MSIRCPKCSQPLCLEVSTKYIYSIKEITINDVVIDEALDQERVLQFKCMDCDFKGWLDDYHLAIMNVSQLFNKEGKLLCSCSLDKDC